MKQTTIRYNLDGLDELRKAIGDQYVTRVGVLNEKTQRDDGTLNNAEIGFIQMFGSLTHNIPPRDFLLMPLQHERKEFLRSISSSSIKTAMAEKNYKKVFELLGVKAQEIIDNAFATAGFGQWPPNAPRTVAAKGDPAWPLIDTGQLRAAITSDVKKKGEL